MRALVSLIDAAVRRAGLDDQVLIVVLVADVEDVESGGPEEAGQGAKAEIGAGLVGDVPERQVPQDPVHVRNLEEHHGVAPWADGLADQAHELAGGLDVLQRVTAADEVGGEAGVLVGVVLREVRYARSRLSGQRPGRVAGSDADGVVAALPGRNTLE